MRNWWWKVLCVILMLYSIIGGFLVPLHSGIEQVDTTILYAGKSNAVAVLGYNSRFVDGEMNAWIKIDSVHFLKAKSVQVENSKQLRAVFDVPAAMPYAKDNYEATLIIDGKQNGVSLLPTAFFIRPDSARVVSETAWSNQAPANFHNDWRLSFPYRNVLAETIRNTFFHVPLWFAMLLLFGISVYHSIRFLGTRQLHHDQASWSYALVGTMFGILGLVTGAIWAKNTWGAYWSFDVKQNMSLIAVLIYCAYFVLRSSFDDDARKGRIGAVYNIFAFSTMIPLLFVIPRMNDSLHPGNGGNPAFGSQDLDNTMRLFFYPSVIAFMLLGVWVAQLYYRHQKIQAALYEKQNDLFDHLTE